MEIITCENRCWCDNCKKPIKKGEKFLWSWKNAFKGSTRANICKKCFIKLFLIFDVTKDEEIEARKEMVLEAL